MAKKEGFFRKIGEEFKAFALRGNVIDLAVGVIIGASFQNVVNAIVNIIMELISAGIGQVNFDSLSFTVRGVAITYGTVLTALVNFIIMAFAIFMMVKGINFLSHKQKKEEAAVVTVKACPYCKTDIHIEATKCPNCTSEV